MTNVLGNEIPKFNRESGDENVAGFAGLTMLTRARRRNMFEIAVILLVAGFIIGGAELLIFAMEVPQYVLPRPSQIAVALVTEWGFLQPHVLVTLYELAFGFPIGA